MEQKEVHSPQPSRTASLLVEIAKERGITVSQLLKETARSLRIIQEYRKNHPLPEPEYECNLGIDMHS